LKMREMKLYLNITLADNCQSIFP